MGKVAVTDSEDRGDAIKPSTAVPPNQLEDESPLSDTNKRAEIRDINMIDSVAAPNNSEKTDMVQHATEGSVSGSNAYMSKRQMAWVSAVLCLATFCVSLDNTIVSTAVPQIVRTFHSIDDVGWYAAIYPLMSCAFQPSYGKVYRLVSHKIVFSAALVIFELGSVVCAVSRTSIVFILGRALAGLGSAGIQAGTTLLIADCVPLRQRPTYNSIIGSIFAVGSVAGPLMGGAFSDTTTWRWCFYVNLPIGGAVLLFVALFYPQHQKRQDERSGVNLWAQIARFDVPGTLVFIAAIICMLMALTWGGSKYAWNNAHSIGLLATAGALLVIFVAVEWRMKDRATIPLRLFTRRNMIGGLWFGLCLGGVFFVNVFYIPLWFQIVDGVSAVESALLFIPFMVSVVGGFVVAGFATAATGYYTPFVWASTVLMSIGAGLITTIQIHSTTRAQWIGYQILCGAGIGMGEEQGLYMVQTTLPDGDVATGVGIILFSITFGGALFVALAQAVFLDRISSLLRTIAPHIDPTSTLLSGGPEAPSTPGLALAYGEAIKGSFRVGLVLATISAIGAVLYDWSNLKLRDDAAESDNRAHNLGEESEV